MIELRGVRKSFGTQGVLDGVDLTIPDGKITVLLGRSGSGKSVTLKHLIGLIRPDAGQVLVDGEDISRLVGTDLNRARLKFGMLFQDAALFDSMTVRENVAFPLVEHARLSRAAIDARVSAALAQVELSGAEDKMPSQLSGGMKKRVGLARATIMEPRIVLYDEPTSGLDPIMADAIHGLIARTQAERGVTSFVISHDVDLAMRLADQVAVLFRGKILVAGTPAEVREHDDPFVRQFLAKSSGGPIAQEEW
jgi:phospholipid/cholesterol/gamma-HCH transport system ATP-binding protein